MSRTGDSAMIIPTTRENLLNRFPVWPASEFRGQTRVVAPVASLHDVLQSLKEQHGFDLLVDITCVDYLNYPEAKDRFGLVYLLANTETNERITVRMFCQRSRSDRAVGGRPVGRGKLAGTRGVGHVRHPFRRPSRLAADLVARGVHGLPAAKRLSLAGPRRAAQLSGGHAWTKS